MNISLDWLKEYVEINNTPEELGEILSDRGFPIEEITQVDGDTVLDVEVTSNRGDCLSHIGVAREIAAATGKSLKMPEIKLEHNESKAEDFISIEIDNSDLCGRYTARIIQGVKVGPSPDWMKRRLEAIGVRSVNNIVDATNYAMMEVGQPTHAFDYEKIAGQKIAVRQAKKGEKIVSIDGTKCKLKEDYLMITDAQRPVAIAGVMGGLDTEISETTQTVLLESAHFAPLSVRTASRALSILSDSSFRFERNVDIENVDIASQRTVQLIQMVAGGTVAQGVVDVYPATYEPVKVSMRLARMNSLLGFEISTDEVMSIFTALGFNPVLNGDVVDCSIASWRKDMHREVDLIEEVIRSHGYNNIPTEKRINIEIAKVDPAQKFKTELRTYLSSSGFYETINVTFTDKKTASLFSLDDSKGYVSVKDVTRKNNNLLRDSLVSSLMTVYKSNHNVGNETCRIYELAHTFINEGENSLPVEKMKLALLCDSDFRVLKGVIEGIIIFVNKSIKVDFKVVNYKWANIAAEIFANGKPLGYIGIVSKDTCSKMDLKSVEPVIAELDFETLMSLQAGPVDVEPLPRYPAIVRDLSIIVDEDKLWQDVYSNIRGSNCTYLEEVSFVEVYKGKPIPKGKKSLTLSLTFRDEDGTLTHERVDEFEGAILSSLKESLSAEIRTV